jgi:hypothetical protein
MALNAETGWGRGSIFGRPSEEGFLNRDGVLLAPESACIVTLEIGGGPVQQIFHSRGYSGRAPFLIVWRYRSILPGRMFLLGFTHPLDG